jgi:hypothetical protein
MEKLLYVHTQEKNTSLLMWTGTWDDEFVVFAIRLHCLIILVGHNFSILKSVKKHWDMCIRLVDYLLTILKFTEDVC